MQTLVWTQLGFIHYIGITTCFQWMCIDGYGFMLVLGGYPKRKNLFLFYLFSFLKNILCVFLFYNFWGFEKKLYIFFLVLFFLYIFNILISKFSSFSYNFFFVLKKNLLYILGLYEFSKFFTFHIGEDHLYFLSI
jgi:hypothetical protein